MTNLCQNFFFFYHGGVAREVKGHRKGGPPFGTSVVHSVSGAQGKQFSRKLKPLISERSRMDSEDATEDSVSKRYMKTGQVFTDEYSLSHKRKSRHIVSVKRRVSSINYLRGQKL